VKLLHSFEDSENVYLLLELCPNQTLNELLRRRKRLTEFEVQVYLLQMVDVLKHLKEKRVIHRDLKLGKNNFILSEFMMIILEIFTVKSSIFIYYKVFFIFENFYMFFSLFDNIFYSFSHLASTFKKIIVHKN
jgi:serine/threonine protein kinase